MDSTFLKSICANKSSRDNCNPDSASHISSVKIRKSRSVSTSVLGNHQSAGVLSNKENIVLKKQSASNRTHSIKDYFSAFPKHDADKKRKFNIHDDNVQTAKKSKITQTDQIDYDSLSTMYSTKPNEKYWEMRSEQQRAALDEALKENQQLTAELQKKDEEIAELKSEVQVLEEASSYAFKLASCLENLDMPSDTTAKDEEGTSNLASSSKDDDDDDNGDDCNQSDSSFQSINTSFSDDDEEKENIPPEVTTSPCKSVDSSGKDGIDKQEKQDAE